MLYSKLDDTEEYDVWNNGRYEMYIYSKVDRK